MQVPVKNLPELAIRLGRANETPQPSSLGLDPIAKAHRDNLVVSHPLSMSLSLCIIWVKLLKTFEWHLKEIDIALKASCKNLLCRIEHGFNFLRHQNCSCFYIPFACAKISDMHIKHLLLPPSQNFLCLHEPVCKKESKLFYPKLLMHFQPLCNSTRYNELLLSTRLASKSQIFWGKNVRMLVMTRSLSPALSP